MSKIKETEIIETNIFSEMALKNVKDWLRYHAIQNHVYYVNMKVNNGNTRLIIDLVSEEMPEF